MFSDKLRQSEKDYTVRQVTRSNHKKESRRPKETIIAILELGDCLRVGGAHMTYGNGASVVNRSQTLLKGGRKCLFGLNSQHNGVRCYSTEIERDLPKRFENLIKLCHIPREEVKINDIYQIMFNKKMYEVAYHKLRSKPGYMTPGITPITLDGISME
jgi:hypothetical protein